MVSWLFLYALATGASCRMVHERRQDDGGLDLADIIRDSDIIQSDLQAIEESFKKQKNVVLPYAEGELKSSGVFKMDDINKNFDNCFYLRRIMDPKSYKAELDIYPTLDRPRVMTGENPRLVKVTESTAKIDINRLGWNKENSDEKGDSNSHSLSLDMGPQFFKIQNSLTTTVYGNRRSTTGSTGEDTKQTEFRREESWEEQCKAFRTCYVVTYVVIRTLKGSCTMLPFVDTSCYFASTGSTSLRSKNVSLAAFGTMKDTASQFFEFSPSANSSYCPAFGSLEKGILMHKPDLVVRNKFDNTCEFKYVVRLDGTPMRTQAMISIPRSSGTKITDTDESPNGAPNLLAETWVVRSNGVGYCQLSDNWEYEPYASRNEHLYYNPTSRAWSNEPSWRPRNLDERCGGHKTASQTPKTLKAVEWIVRENKPNYCLLENDWRYQMYEGKPNYRDPATKVWLSRPNWPMPEGLDEKCPEAANDSPSKRSVDIVEDNEISIDIIMNDVPEFLKAMDEGETTGFAEV